MQETKVRPAERIHKMSRTARCILHRPCAGPGLDELVMQLHQFAVVPGLKEASILDLRILRSALATFQHYVVQNNHT